MFTADTLSRVPLSERTSTDFEDIAALADTEQQQALNMVPS